MKERVSFKRQKTRKEKNIQNMKGCETCFKERKANSETSGLKLLLIDGFQLHIWLVCMQLAYLSIIRTVIVAGFLCCG